VKYHYQQQSEIKQDRFQRLMGLYYGFEVTSRSTSWQHTCYTEKE